MPSPPRRAVWLLGAVWGVVACASGPTVESSVKASAGAWRLSGYHASWTGDAWRDYPGDLLDRIYFFELALDDSGRLDTAVGWPGAWGGLRAWAETHEIQVVPTVSLHGAVAFESVFGDPGRARRVATAVNELVRADPLVAGVHIDVEVFEAVSSGARDGFTAFVVELARELDRAPGTRSLSVFLPGFDPADAYNERALAAVADELVIQGYDLHHRQGDRAGPVAPIRGWPGRSWTDLLARFDSLGVPRSRLTMGVPLYGYEWPTVDGSPGSDTRGDGVTLALDPRPGVAPELRRTRDEVERYGLRRDPASASPWYAHRSDDGWVQGWFEDPVSLAAKAEFARQHGLAGIALFPLAYGGAREWAAIREASGG